MSLNKMNVKPVIKSKRLRRLIEILIENILDVSNYDFHQGNLVFRIIIKDVKNLKINLSSAKVVI